MKQRGIKLFDKQQMVLRPAVWPWPLTTLSEAQLGLSEIYGQPM